MAEYIDRENIETEEMKHYRSTLNSHDAKLFVEFMSWIDDVPSADVVERSKIDEAIEVFRKEIEENHLNVIDYADGEWLVKDFIYGAIDRLKRNIGE